MVIFLDFYAQGIINVTSKETYIYLILTKVDAKTVHDLLEFFPTI